ncbi:GH16 domain-containing protein [Plasmodiophora brassicae]|uniref:GH16 domain-containing protein n=1 Tax=Plasmodiophora brassicae TaxID=37360 RepID=A0A0G4ILP8_PLABS|nr:hypothetical protein PBRA_004861 [Plasmodiophora brassicae]SPQ93283.1 unnamed protein product [Plasmodiophora brassicae]
MTEYVVNSKGSPQRPSKAAIISSPMCVRLLVCFAVVVEVTRAQLPWIPCQTPDNKDPSKCLFDGEFCNWATDFVNFDNEAVWFHDYAEKPVPSASAQFVIEGGDPTIVDGQLKIPMKYPKNLEEASTGTVVSTARFLHYGVVSATFNQSGVDGVVTSFITMSNTEDEIDIEIVGADRYNIQYNWYWHAMLVKNRDGASAHGRLVTVPYDTALNLLTHTIDWNEDRIIWLVNGVEYYRVHNPGDGNFPSDPSRISFGIWQTPLASDWAGFTNYSAWDPEEPPFVVFSDMSVSCAAKNGPPAVVSKRPPPTKAPDPVCTDVLNCLFGPVVSEAPAETIIVTGALILVVTAVLLVL